MAAHCFDAPVQGSASQKRRHSLSRRACAASWQHTIPNANAFAGLTLPWFFLRFRFTLATPYMSRGEEADNYKVTRDWTFNCPYVRASTWKGVLLSTCRDILNDKPNKKERLEYLFGTEKAVVVAGADVEGRRGHLHFFPTFFDVEPRPAYLMPMPRKTRGGGTLATLEAVMPGATGDFAILLAADLVTDIGWYARFISGAIFFLLIRDGFGGKRLKGFGLARQQVTEVSLWTPAVGPRNLGEIALSTLHDRVSVELRGTTP